MRHWHKCRRWKEQGFACPFGTLPDHPVEDEEADDDEREFKYVPVPARRRRPPKRKTVGTMAEVVREIETAPKPRVAVARPGTREAFGRDPFGGMVGPLRPALPYRVPSAVRARALSRAGVRAPARSPSRVRAPAASPIPFRSTVPTDIAVKAMRVGFVRSAEPEPATRRAAVTEAASARTFAQASKESRLSKKRLAAAAGAAATGAAAAAAVKKFGGPPKGKSGTPYRGGRGGFFVNQAAWMKRLSGAGARPKTGPVNVTPL